MTPLISVIIPVYNRASELPASLESLARQTYQPIEVIVVDDGSAEPIDRIVKAYPTLAITLHRQENRGAPSARNAGFRLSRGEYVLFWDADVIGEPQMIEKLYRALVNTPDASFAYCSFVIGNKKMPAQAFDAAALRRQNYICTMSLMRRDAFPGFDESLARFQDWDLWLTMVERGSMGVWVPEYLFRAVVRGSTMSTWLPRFAYHAPFRWLPIISRRVRKYEQSRAVVIKKHAL